MLKRFNNSFLFLFIIVSVSVTAYFYLASVTDQSTEKIPLTGFEKSGFNKWTSLESEIEFIKKIEEMSKRVIVTEKGMSTEGRPIHLIKITNGLHSNDELIGKQSILIMGAPHGDEPVGREVALRLIRDLALTNNKEKLNLLDISAVLVLPTPNPDGRYYNIRENIDGINNNRDHLNLKTQESIVIGNVLNKYSPDLIIDLHERPKSIKTDVQFLWPRNLNVEQKLYDLNKKMIKHELMDSTEELGYTVDLYGSPGGLGNEDETILRNLGALRYSITVLVETAGLQSPVDRINTQTDVLESLLNYYSDNFEEISAIVDGAPLRKMKEYFGKNGTFYFSGADNYKENLKRMKTKICGYLLDDSQIKTIQKHIDLFSIKVKKTKKDNNFIPMSQPMLTIIPYLVDERSTNSEVKAIPLTDCSTID